MAAFAPINIFPLYRRAVEVLYKHPSVDKRHPLRTLLGLLLARNKVPRLGASQGVGASDLESALNYIFEKKPPFDKGTSASSISAARPILQLFGDVKLHGSNEWRNAFNSQKGLGCFAAQSTIVQATFRLADRANCQFRIHTNRDTNCSLSANQSPCKSIKEHAGEVPKLLHQQNNGRTTSYRLVPPEPNDMQKLLNQGKRVPLWPMISAIYSGSPLIDNEATFVTDEKFCRDLAISRQTFDSLFDDDTNNPDNKAIIGMTEPALLTQVRYELHQKGFHINLRELINFYLSLKPRAFVILAGLSGTGKSRLPAHFFEIIQPPKHIINRQVVPVRPGWSDVADLLGFYNSLRGHFEPGPALKAFINAESLATTGEGAYPAMLLLDEMNLARVEHYFADVLSTTEGRRKTSSGKWETDPIILPGWPNMAEIPVPDNLFIIGTVNIDESTQGLPSKVLDRANTIEFEHVYFKRSSVPKPILQSGELHFLGHYLTAKPYRTFNQALTAHRRPVLKILASLHRLHKLLRHVRAHFGNRTIEDIALYIAYASDLIQSAKAAKIDLEGFDEKYAFDRQVLQKVLPRLGGVREEIQRRYVTTGGKGDFFNALIEELKKRKCIDSAEKVNRMKDQDIVNFWEA